VQEEAAGKQPHTGIEWKAIADASRGKTASRDPDDGTRCQQPNSTPFGREWPCAKDDLGALEFAELVHDHLTVLSFIVSMKSRAASPNSVLSAEVYATLAPPS